MNFEINNPSLQNVAALRQSTANNKDIHVDGNKISWPDDGWYEVQSATSYNTMSEGGTSATMPHGTYNLINHTTGERFENIQIGLSSPDLRLSADSPSKDIQVKNKPVANNDVRDPNDPRPQVPETIHDGDTTFSPEGDLSVGQYLAELAASTGVGYATGNAAGAIGGAFLYIHQNTDVEHTPGTIPNTVVYESSDYNPATNETTTTEQYQDGTYVQSTFNHNDGSTVTQHVDNSGSLTTTVTTNDVDAVNSPQTEVTTHPDGSQTTIAISPTGGRYPASNATNAQLTPSNAQQTPTADSSSTGSGAADSGLSTSLEAANEYSNGNVGGEYGGTPTAPEPDPEPVSQPSTPSRPSVGNYSENDSNSHGGGGGVSSSQSAADGGYGTSEQGEFG